MRRWGRALSALVAWTQVTVSEGCCKGSKPDPTFVDSNEYYLTAITPNRGTLLGGSRVTLTGGGFNVNFFTGGNYVFIGSDSRGWVQCDVIEGACTVECGGPHTLVCDTGPWTAPAFNGWLDVKVMIEVFGQRGADETVVIYKRSAYFYYGKDYAYSPTITGVVPHAASADEGITLSGLNLGYWIQDYRIVYVGSGRAPQGGIVTSLILMASCVCF